MPLVHIFLYLQVRVLLVVYTFNTYQQGSAYPGARINSTI